MTVRWGRPADRCLLEDAGLRTYAAIVAFLIAAAAVLTWTLS